MSCRAAEWAAQHEAQVEQCLKQLRVTTGSGRDSSFVRTQLAGTKCWLVFIRHAERVCVWKCSEAQSAAVVAARSTAGVTVRSDSATSLSDEVTVRPQALLIAALERKRALRGKPNAQAEGPAAGAAPAAAAVIDLCDDSDEDEEGAGHGGAAAGGTPAKRQKTAAAPAALTTPARLPAPPQATAASPAAARAAPAAGPDAALMARVAALEAAASAAQRRQAASDVRADALEARQSAQRAALAQLCAAAGSAVAANSAVADAVRQLAQTFNA